MDLALLAVTKGIGKGKWGFGKGQNWNEKGGKGGKDVKAERQWQERRQRARERRQGRHQNVLDVRQDRTHCSLVQERRKQDLVRNR